MYIYIYVWYIIYTYICLFFFCKCIYIYIHDIHVYIYIYTYMCECFQTWAWLILHWDVYAQDHVPALPVAAAWTSARAGWGRVDLWMIYESMNNLRIWLIYPLIMTEIPMENGPVETVSFFHEKGWCSIVISNYQKVPSGTRLINDGQIHHVSWENSLLRLGHT